MHRSLAILIAALAALPAADAPAQKVVLGYLGGLKVETPVVHKNLTIFPLTTTRYERSFDALTLDQASRQGVLNITELGSGNVNRVLVENTSRRYVFLMAGELLAGCKQDRMVANDCLLEPRSGKVELSVYCTEHGRWTSQTNDFKSLGASAHVRMRQVAKESGSQQQVWDEVRSKAAGLSVTPAPTEALQSVIGDKEVAARCAPYKKHFDQIPNLGPNVVGVAVASGDEIICIDVFASPALLRALWPKLLQSYVLDVIDRPDSRCRVAGRDIERILDRAPDADFRTGATDGAGSAWSISGQELTGSALVHRSSVVHCDLFPSRPVVPDDGEAPKLDYRRQRTR
jgi:hypothetical protein